jgi:hypothetical protein
MVVSAINRGIHYFLSILAEMAFGELWFSETNKEIVKKKRMV